MSVTILTGDCRDVLPTLPSASVQCVVTSPPYFGLRDYGAVGQIGLESTVEDYVAELVAVFREVRRVLADDGCVFLNLGDSYMSSGPRQTGRNDTNRETPGGRGGSFRGGPRVAVHGDAQHGAAYGTTGKAPASYPDRDCLCGSLCDACRVAYQIGKSHSDGQPVPTLTLSSSETNRERMESGSGRLPTSDSSRREGHNADAIRDLEPAANHECARPLSSQETTPDECAQPLPGPCLLGETQGAECRLCGRSLVGCAPPSERMTACPCAIRTNPLSTSDRLTSTDDNGEIGDSLVSRTAGKASDLAYPHYTIASRLKPKDLIGIPWRVAFALQADGWWLRKDNIWHKPNPMPESVNDRTTTAHEYVFHFSKSARYYYDAAAIAERGTQHAQGTLGEHAGQKYAAIKDVRSSTLKDANRETRNKRSVWTIATQPTKEAHFATYPEALVEPCILAGSRVGDTVLDPFGGSGTTGRVAERLGRHSVLIELNPAYVGLIEKRTAQRGLLAVAD